VTSERKIAANRRNAQRSSGPRSDQGKKSARRNALKHGLTGKISGSITSSDEVRRIALQICNTDSTNPRFGVAIDIAEAQVFLNRVRAIRVALMERLLELGGRDAPAGCVAFGKYPARDVDRSDQAWKTLTSLERYETKARARRRRAIREFDDFDD
jgi:hypothetical protein